ncbi:MAG: hypothetical protein CMH83_13060 [Nocardioides sp.]|nr:hypothetical protein [Nocardioides sp.]
MLVVVLALALVVGGGYYAAWAVAGEEIPRGTEVAGVDVGGLSATEAEEALRDGLAERAAAPIPVEVDGETFPLDPAEAGLSVDYAASVADAGAGSSWHPADLWTHYTGSSDRDAVVTVDQAALDAALDTVDAEVAIAPVEGAVGFRSGEIRTRTPEDGTALDRAAARSAVLAAYLTGESAQLTTTAVAPEVDEDDVRRAVDEFANPALSAAVVLRFGASRVRLDPEDYVTALSTTEDGGELRPEVDVDALAALVDEVTGDAGEPVDARIELRNGKPRVVPAKPGVTYEPEAIAASFLDAVVLPEGERVVKVDGEVDQPEFTTRDAKRLGVKEKVSEFTTYFPYAEYRNVNLSRAADLIDGTLLLPGDTFSMNGIVGERTRENGFTEGTIISNGVYKADLGGGVSQIATTTFNAMFFAGLEDVEHKPHSFYIDRYPVGREATLAWPVVDLQFTNDTDHGVYIEAFVVKSTPSSQGEATVRMYSTKTWDIESRTSDRYNYTSPDTRRLRTVGCIPNTGYSGFTVDVTRVFRKPGVDAVDHTEVFTTVYTPSDSVICLPPQQSGGGGGGE